MSSVKSLQLDLERASQLGQAALVGEDSLALPFPQITAIPTHFRVSVPQVFHQLRTTPGCAADAATFSSLLCILDACEQLPQVGCWMGGGPDGAFQHGTGKLAWPLQYSTAGRHHPCLAALPVMTFPCSYHQRKGL